MKSLQLTVLVGWVRVWCHAGIVVEDKIKMNIYNFQ
jgi:hypothetical protein